MKPIKMGRFLGFLVLVLSAAILTGCATDQQVISQATDTHGSLKPAVISDPELTSYIQSLGTRIITSARQLHEQKYGPESHFKEDSAWMFNGQMQFHFVASDTINAFTTGGEHMYIYTELFTQCKTEDELAAVMAHEFAHVYCRHVHKGMNRQYTMMGVAAAAGGAGYVAADKDRTESAMTYATAALAAAQFVGMGFTRGDEAEADKLGFDFYAHAGWAPSHFGDFFQHMIDRGYDTTPEIMSDHPSLKGRVQQAKQFAAALPAAAKSWRLAPVANATRFTALQKRASAVAKSLPNDNTLAGAKLLAASFPSCVSPVDQPQQIKARQQLKSYLAKPQAKTNGNTNQPR